jgi:hypothetical protein
VQRGATVVEFGWHNGRFDVRNGRPCEVPATSTLLAKVACGSLASAASICPVWLQSSSIALLAEDNGCVETSSTCQ